MFRFKLSLIYSFVMPALLINSVGVVILQMVNIDHVTKSHASYLEAYKDLSIMFVSLLFASLLPKLGYKKGLLLGLGLALVACVLMGSHPTFMMAKLFFILSGASMAFLKMATYSSVGLLTENSTRHASFISMLEGFFMLGVLSGFWLFSYFIQHYEWSHVYWLLAALNIVGLILVITTKIDEHALKDKSVEVHSDYKNMAMLLTHGVIWVFIVLAFFYVFIEQGVTTWLPTFNNHVLHITDAMSVKIAGMLAAGIMLGRLAGGVLMHYIHWRKFLVICAIGAIILLMLAIYVTTHSTFNRVTSGWFEIPFVAYLIPIVGFFIGPIYPTICSSILSAHPNRLHSAITGLIIVFSALGGTIGSRVVGISFDVFGGLTAIKVPLFPLVLMLFLLWPYYYFLRKKKA